MKKRILRYIKHIVLTILFAAPIVFVVGIMAGNDIRYNKNPLRLNLDEEGPYVFFQNDSILDVSYTKGDRTNGFYVKNEKYPAGTPFQLTCFYPIDSSSFKINITPGAIRNYPVTYQNVKKIIAISDIEGNYGTFRDFLINNKVIDQQLNWIFGDGHLVLVGDFIDRGYFTTQLFWLIYKLEQDALTKGGQVHFVLGNHEIMNMQGDHRYAPSKYNYVASILGRKQFELYGKDSFIGRWLASKNTLVLINDNLFVHGGLHPDIATSSMDIYEINQVIQDNYYRIYYPMANEKKERKLLLSSKTSPYWYRGYFDKNLTNDQIDLTLNKFNASTVIVGHTIQSKVKTKHNGKVIGIDVKHPQDHIENWPGRESEGLWIENGTYYRILEDGSRKKIK